MDGETFSTWLEAIPHPALVADADWIVRAANAAALELFPAHDALASTLASLAPPAPFRGWEIELAELAAGDVAGQWRRAWLTPILGASSAWDVAIRPFRFRGEVERRGLRADANPSRADASRSRAEANRSSAGSVRSSAQIDRPSAASRCPVATGIRGLAACGACSCGCGYLVTLTNVTAVIDLERERAAQERLLSIGRLAAKVAHELNNPLDGILRYLGLARKLCSTEDESGHAGAKGGLPARAGECNGGARSKLPDYLDEARAGLMRMAKIIRELLEFSRRASGDADPIPVNDVVEQAIRAVLPRADEQGVIIAADFQDRDMPALPGGRLLQVCLNLLKNALDAMPRGGRILLTTARVGPNVVIRLADTGPGIPLDAAGLFEPFHTTKPAGEGTGLGLAICKDLVERMGGGMAAANAEEGGAVFTVRIPATRTGGDAVGTTASGTSRTHVSSAPGHPKTANRLHDRPGCNEA